MFKRLLIALLLPLIFILTGFQVLGLFFKVIFIWVATGKDTCMADKELLIEKVFKLLEKDETN